MGQTGERAEQVLMLVALCAAFIGRVGALILAGNFNPKTAQLWEYGEQGLCAFRTGGSLCLAYHGLYPYASAYMPPSASYLWLVLFHVFGVTPAALAAFSILSLLAGVASVWLLFDLALNMTRSVWAAFFAAAFTAIYPTFVYVTAIYHTTNLTLASNLMLVWLCWKIAVGDTRIATLVCAGLVSAFCALTRSEMLVIGPLLIGLSALWRWPARGQFVKILAVSGAVMGLGMAPWIARNETVFGRFIPTAQSSGYNLWKGFSRFADGSGNSIEMRPEAEREAGRIRASVPFGSDYEHRINQAFQNATIADLKSTSVSRHIHLLINKLLMTWVFDWTDPITHRPAYFAPWLLTSVLALFGAARICTSQVSLDPVLLSFAAAMLFLLTAAYAVTDVHSRYRMHLEPFLFIFAGLGAEGALLMICGRFGFRPLSVSSDRFEVSR
jgi:hypothetical protein